MQDNGPQAGRAQDNGLRNDRAVAMRSATSARAEREVTSLGGVAPALATVVGASVVAAVAASAAVVVAASEVAAAAVSAVVAVAVSAVVAVAVSAAVAAAVSAVVAAAAIDIRLKHDIVLLGHLPNGLGYYRFSYHGSDRAYVGVMAQEVQPVMPKAVVHGRDGTLRVRYGRLGVKFQTYDDGLRLGRPNAGCVRSSLTCRAKHVRSRMP